MAASTTVNGRTVVHRASGGALATFPDVCLTPSPGGPVPVPYPNLARSADLVRGSATVTVDGNPVAVEDSAFGRSTGDEPGTQKGVLSHAQGGEARFLNWSFDVKVEGKGVPRLLDPMASNGGSPLNTPPAGEVQPPLGVPPAPGPDDDPGHLIDVTFRYARPAAGGRSPGPTMPTFETPLDFTGPEHETWSPLFDYSGAVFYVWETDGDFQMRFDTFDLTQRPLLPESRVSEALRTLRRERNRLLEHAWRMVQNAIEDLRDVLARLTAEAQRIWTRLNARAQQVIRDAQVQIERAIERAGEVLDLIGAAISAGAAGEWAEAASRAASVVQAGASAARDAAAVLAEYAQDAWRETRRTTADLRRMLKDAARGLDQVAGDLRSATIGL